ncbi:MAG: Lcl C-terminal domain-containing protein [Caldimonas sp.]
MTLSRGAALGSRFAACSLLVLAAAAGHAQGRFAVSADGHEVTDATTRLTWRRCAEGLHWDGKTCTGRLVNYNYAGAKSAANAARSSGKPWRVPTREELVGLVDPKAKKKPRVDWQAFPRATNGPYWATREGRDDNLNAWLVNFGSGKVRANLGQAKFPLRLVRPAS